MCLVPIISPSVVFERKVTVTKNRYSYMSQYLGIDVKMVSVMNELS